MSNDLSAFFGDTSFTPATVDPQPDFDVLPPGKYPILIEAAEVKATKAGTGHIIALTLQVLDGPCKGRKLFDNINLQNPNVQCVEIGMRELSALVKAIGLQGEDWKDLDLYINQIVVAHVKVKGDQNNVRTYSASVYSSAQAPMAVPAPEPVAPAAVDPRGVRGPADALPVAAPVPAAPVPPEQTPQGMAAPAATKPPWER